jgi:hypothetical protein
MARTHTHCEIPLVRHGKAHAFMGITPWTLDSPLGLWSKVQGVWERGEPWLLCISLVKILHLQLLEAIDDGWFRRFGSPSSVLRIVTFIGECVVGLSTVV